MKKKLSLCILAVLLVWAWPGEAAVKSTSLRVAVEPWVRFKTVDASGMAEFWATRPFKVKADGSDFWFWWSETAEAYYGSVETGVPNRHPNKVWRVK